MQYAESCHNIDKQFHISVYEHSRALNSSFIDRLCSSNNYHYLHNRFDNIGGWKMAL